MPYILDTSVVIHLRDANADVVRRVGELGERGEAVMLSIISRVELEGGVYRNPADAGARRARLDALLDIFPVLAFDDSAAEAYGAIVSTAGYSRRKLLDRMIAAQAVIHRATLVTMNSADFADIPDLDVLSWDYPSGLHES